MQLKMCIQLKYVNVLSNISFILAIINWYKKIFLEKSHCKVFIVLQ
jgi:hypothetical protein